MKNKFKNIFKSIKEKFKKKTPVANFNYEELAENIPALFSFSTVLEAMEIFKVHNVSAIPVVNFNHEVVGLINEKDIAHLVALQSSNNWSSLKDYTVDSLIKDSNYSKTWEDSLEDLTVEFTNQSIEILPIIDKEKKYSGYCITPAKLISYASNSIKPRTLGGLATPLGVYLTDGYYNAGAGSPGLIFTGLLFGLVINILSMGSEYLYFNYHFSESILLVLQLGVFLVLLRISPLVGYHSAEHQTIHAIERGIDLTFENVKNQPKEHERCGTNFMILVLGLSLLILFSLEFWKGLKFWEHSLLLIIFATLIVNYWKKIGMALQKFFTTVEATDKQLQSGIKAGQQLLEKYKNNTQPIKITPLRKIWNMGIIQVLLSFTLVSLIIQYLRTFF
ncbi:MAG: DUF1385 domain-containing protein [Cyanobacteriota bacterium]